MNVDDSLPLQVIHEPREDNMIDIKAHMETQHGGVYSGFLKNIIYGGVDGVITTFAIVTASYAADLNVKTILVLGLSNVLADGFSMGFGDYASSYSERDLYVSERSKETIEYERNRDFETDELTQFYMQKGMSKEDSEAIVATLSKSSYKEIFIDHMMLLEFNMCEPDENQEIVKKAISTVVSFYVFGLFPLMIYIVARLINFHNKHFIFAWCTVVCAFTLFSIGAFGAYISKRPLVSGGMVTLSNGAIASALAYLIGYSMNTLLN